MESNEILEGNVLIGGYMGITMYYMIEINQLMYNVKSDVPIYLSNWSEMEFHKSYDWLMPVVEKIEQGNFGFKMCRKVVEIYYDDSKEIILKVKEKSRFESLYKAVIQFIKWYNKTLNNGTGTK